MASLFDPTGAEKSLLFPVFGLAAPTFESVCPRLESETIAQQSASLQQEACD
jgi:hypothetical protein